MRISDWSSDVCSSDLRKPGYRISLADARVQCLVRRIPGAGSRTEGGPAAGGAKACRPAEGSFFRGAEESACHPGRSEEHTSELQSLMRISYAVFCLKKKQTISTITQDEHTSYHTYIP